MVTRLLFLIIPLCVGAAVGCQAPINAALSRQVGPLRSALISVTVSLICLGLAVGINRGGGSVLAAGAAPRWALVGGLMGVIALVGTVISVPRIGTAATLTVVVVGQLATAAAIDHFGWLGVAQRPMDSTRVLGLLFLVAGGALVVRR